MGEKNFHVFLSIVLAFTLIISILGAGAIGGGEFEFNYTKAKEGCVNFNPVPENQFVTSKKTDCEAYAPLFHWLASPFTFTEKSFFFFTVIFFAFFPAYFLFRITHHWMAAWLFFSSTSVFYYLIDGVFPQFLAFTLLLGVLAFKDWRIQLGFVVLSIFAHGHGFYLSLLGFVFSRAWALYKSGGFDFKNIFLECSGVFGTQRPPILEQRIVVDTPIAAVKAGTEAYPIAWTNLLSLVTKIFPLPFYLFGLWYSWKNKYRWDLIAIAVVAVLWGFLNSFRAWYIVPLVLIPSVTMFYLSLPKTFKRVFFGFTVLLFLFQLWSWYNYKILCQ